MPDKALQRLMEGNRRFAADKATSDQTSRRPVEVASEQDPFAMIFSCVDSRVAPELLFDQGLGDLFVIRTAGQVLDRAVLGSLEFGVAELHIPLLMVLGHQHCGALKAAMEFLAEGDTAVADLEFMVVALRPAVEAGKNSDHPWDGAVRAQISLVVEQLRRSPILEKAVTAGTLKIVGAWYNLETGRVEITNE